ncbi:MAG: hypothetical protein V3T98_01555 [Candidatus Paceibacterota bacterium]
MKITKQTQNFALNRHKTFCVGFVFLFSVGFVLLPLTIKAASPQFLTSWQADSYTPSWYQGKIFPTRGSLINVSFELIDNNKIINLSRNKIRWYINDKLFKNEDSGLGIKSLKFINNNPPGSDVEIKIAIVDYGANPLYKIIHIQIVMPEAIIDAPYPERKTSTGENSFRVFPFFFNIKDLNELSFEWLANEQTAGIAENPQELSLNIDTQTPSGIAINLKVIIKNITDQFEFASKNIKLEIK